MAKAKFTGTSKRFNSLHKGKSISEVVDYLSNPNAYAGEEDIPSLLDDITQFSFLNSSLATNIENAKLMKLYNLVRDSKKQTKAVGAAVSTNTTKINKIISNDLAKAKKSATAAKKSSRPDPRTSSSVSSSPKNVLSGAANKISASQIKPTIVPIKTSSTNNKLVDKSPNRVVRTKEQVQQEKLVKVENDRHKLQNQTLKIKNESEKIRTELLRLDFNKKQFEEDIRHRMEKEYTERVRLDARESEAKNKEREISQKSKQTESSEKIAKSRVSLSRKKIKRQYDFMESDAGKEYSADKNKTERSKQSAMNRRAKLSFQRAELSLTTTRARNLMKEKQLEDRRMRDLLRENSKREHSAKSKSVATQRAIFEGIKQTSPTMAYTYLGAKKVQEGISARKAPIGDLTTKAPSATKESSSGSWLGAAIGSAGAYAAGAAGGRGGMLSKVLPYGKKMISGLGAGGSATNPANIRYMTNLASSGAPAAIASGAKVPLAQKMSQAVGAGKSAGKLMGKVPIIGAAITGALEYNDSGSAGRAVAVGAGSMAGASAGAAIGAAAGSFIPGAGTLVGGFIGGIAGAYLGESGMKALTNKFLGKTEKQLNRESSFTDTDLSAGKGRNIQKVSPAHLGKAIDPSIVSPSTKNSPKTPQGKPAKDDNSFYAKAYNAVYSSAIKSGAKNPEVLAELGATQASLESGYGKHAPGNNFFGIKGGSGQKLKTKEFINGKMQSVDSNFEKYNSLEKSAEHYVGFLSKYDRYKPVLEASSIGEAINAQGKSGYATDPRYGEKLLQIKRDNASKMIMAQNQLDTQNIAQKSSPAPVNVVNGGASNVTNVQNTTVNNQQDTDPTIRQHQYSLLHVAMVL